MDSPRTLLVLSALLIASPALAGCFGTPTAQDIEDAVENLPEGEVQDAARECLKALKAYVRFLDFIAYISGDAGDQENPPTEERAFGIWVAIHLIRCLQETSGAGGAERSGVLAPLLLQGDEEDLDLSGVEVTLEISRLNRDGEFVLLDTITGTTNNDGEFFTTWESHQGSGRYRVDVVDISRDDAAYDPELNEDDDFEERVAY